MDVVTMTRGVQLAHLKVIDIHSQHKKGMRAARHQLQHGCRSSTVDIDTLTGNVGEGKARTHGQTRCML